MVRSSMISIHQVIPSYGVHLLEERNLPGEIPENLIRRYKWFSSPRSTHLNNDSKSSDVTSIILINISVCGIGGGHRVHDGKSKVGLCGWNFIKSVDIFF